MSILKVNKIQDTTGDDALTFDSSGNTTVNQTLTTTTASITTGGTNNLTISDGDLVIGTSGHGIDFSATADGSGTDTSSLLDDYEEGTWTPVVNIGGSTSGITTSVATGKYTKIGRMIHICCGVVLTDKGSDSGNILFTGLPYAVSDMLAGTSNDAGGVAWYQAGMNSLTTDGIIQARFVNSQIELKYLNSDNNSVSVSGSDLLDSSSWRIDGIYYV